MARLRQLLILICVITGNTFQIAQTSLLNKMCDFSRGYTVKNFQLYQIENGRQGPIIDIQMCNFWRIMPDSYTITIEQMCGFSEVYMPFKIDAK